jgi:dihydrolipoamide dehydrogenase
MLPQILPVEDEEVAKALHRSFEKQGIAVHVGTRCENFKVGADGVSVDLVTGAPSAAEPKNSEPAPGGPKPGEPKATEAKGGETRVTVEAAVLLSAIGVVPNLDGALAANLSPELERGYLKVGEDYQTSIKGIYAAGDIIGPPWLAHVATFEAVSAVNGMFGRGTPHRVRRFPGCTYCQPQVASIGLTEKAARAQGLDVKVGKFPFAASGKAVASAESEGFVKVVADAKTGEIYGAHILGAEATEQIAEFGLAMDLEATVEDIHHTIHAHPTLSEAVMEAAAAVTGEAIHI